MLSLKLKYRLVLALSLTLIMNTTKATNSISVDAPVTTELAGKSAKVAVTAVFRIIDTETNTGGTGFLHKSGKVITAAHVVKNSNLAALKIVLTNGTVINIKTRVTDPDLDLAVIEPEVPILSPALSIKNASSIPTGLQVCTWGFPEGYNRLIPLLTIGYTSGVDEVPTESGKKVPRFVVNAAFNGGNSGGPVIEIENGTVVGVVSSKLAPLPPYIESVLKALANQKSGMVYTATDAQGKSVSVTEGKIVGDVLLYLRSQTQLVVGYAVPLSELIGFLKKAKIEP